MGIEHADLNPTTHPAGATGRRRRALVNQVTPGGPAAAGGVAAGDVVTRVSDFAVDANKPVLERADPLRSGEAVRVVLNRNGRIIETEVRLAKRS
jgi:S1-C subfamily serine protease